MKKNDIIRRIPVSELNIPKLEKWLDQMAKEGLFLKETLGTRWYFYRGEPKVVRYRMDVFDGGVEPDAQKREDYLAMGWKYVTTHSKMYRIYMAEDALAKELHTDGIIESLSLKKLQKYFRNEIMLALLLIVLYCVFPGRNDVINLFQYPYLFFASLDVGTIGHVLRVIWWIGCVCLACYHFRELRKLRRWIELNKNTENVESCPHIGADPKIIRRCIYAWLIVLILSVVFLAEKRVPLDEILTQRRLPILEEIESGIMLPINKTVSIDSNNEYRERVHLLTRDNYEIHEKRTFRKMGTDEIYGASADIYYFDVRASFYAEPLFQEMIKKYAGASSNKLETILVTGKGFDSCLYGTEGEWQILALKKGSRILLIEYKGMEDIRGKAVSIGNFMDSL